MEEWWEVAKGGRIRDPESPAAFRRIFGKHWDVCSVEEEGVEWSRRTISGIADGWNRRFGKMRGTEDIRRPQSPTHFAKSLGARVDGREGVDLLGSLLNHIQDLQSQHEDDKVRSWMVSGSITARQSDVPGW
jgi:hypothetical protein